MNSRVKSSKHIRLPEIVLAVLVAISGILLGFKSGTFIINFKEVGFTVVSSVQNGMSAVVNTGKEFILAIQETANLREENKQLLEQLKNYEFLQRNNTEIRKENERLKEQLDFKESIVQNNYAAQIIGRDPDSLYSGLTINKGTKHGVRKGMPVIAVQNGNVGVVGKIVTAGAGTSIVMPVYDLQCNISCRIQNTRDMGIVSGNGSSDLPLSMKYIKKRVLEEISFGDIIVTSGENNNYLKDIPIGTISKITVLDYDSSLDIELNTIIDFSRLETVIVVDQKYSDDNLKGGK